MSVFVERQSSESQVVMAGYPASWGTQLVPSWQQDRLRLLQVSCQRFCAQIPLSNLVWAHHWLKLHESHEWEYSNCTLVAWQIDQEFWQTFFSPILALVWALGNLMSVCLCLQSSLAIQPSMALSWLVTASSSSLLLSCATWMTWFQLTTSSVRAQWSWRLGIHLSRAFRPPWLLQSCWKSSTQDNQRPMTVRTAVQQVEVEVLSAVG